MRLPYLQVTDEAVRVSGLLGRLLGIDRHSALGRVVSLWAWAIESGPADQAPSGIISGPMARQLVAASMEWDGNPDDLISALDAVGLVEVTETGVRVRGMDRYARTWEKNKRRTPAPVPPESAGIAPVTGTTPAGNRQKPARKTETETKTDRSSDDDLPAGASDDVQQVAAFVLATPEPAGPTPEDLRRTWNQHRAPEQPEWRETSAKRAAAAKARLADRPLYGSPDSWEAVVQRIARSSFARGLVAGANGRTWVADPEWLLRPDSASRTLEGRYDDRAAPAPEKPKSSLARMVPFGRQTEVMPWQKPQ